MVEEGVLIRKVIFVNVSLVVFLEISLSILAMRIWVLIYFVTDVLRTTTRSIISQKWTRINTLKLLNSIITTKCKLEISFSYNFSILWNHLRIKSIGLIILQPIISSLYLFNYSILPLTILTRLLLSYQPLIIFFQHILTSPLSCFLPSN